MTLRHDITPRYFEPTSPFHHEDLARLAESTQQALSTIPLLSYRWVRGYEAGAAGASLPPIPWGANDPYLVASLYQVQAPDCARVVRAVAQAAAGRDTGNIPFLLTQRADFDFEVDGQGRQQVLLYQPGGLVQGEVYDLLVEFVAFVEG